MSDRPRFTTWKRMRRIVPVPAHILAMPTDVPAEVWTNGEYEVFVHYTGSRTGQVWLSIKRMDRESIHDWRHMQQIKNEVIGSEREAVELYPRESRVVDNANQYHLYVAPEGCDWPVGFEGGMVLLRENEVQAYNDAPHPGRQRPMQPGLTIGHGINNARLPEHDKQIREWLGIPRASDA
jgi:hypothetical protein